MNTLVEIHPKVIINTLRFDYNKKKINVNILIGFYYMYIIDNMMRVLLYTLFFSKFYAAMLSIRMLRE